VELGKAAQRRRSSYRTIVIGHHDGCARTACRAGSPASFLRRLLVQLAIDDSRMRAPTGNRQSHRILVVALPPLSGWIYGSTEVRK